MSDEKRVQIQNILTDAGVEYSTRYIGETSRDDWQCDQWVTRFAKQRSNTPHAGAAHLGPVVETFDFYTGLGHRVDTAETKLGRVHLKNVSRNSIAWRDLMKTQKPMPPHAADVLYSVIMDSSACEMSFADWCGGFGYDADSRKALSTYEACQQNADKLKRIFNNAQIESIRTTLEDY